MPHGNDSLERDSSIARILGIFFLVLGVPVLAGTLFAEIAIDLILNLGAGALLFVVGGLFLWWSRRTRARSRRTRGRL